MEIDEFIETDTGKKAVKAIEEQKRDLEAAWGFTIEEMHHIELCMLKVINEMYMTAEELEDDVRYYAKVIDKYRKILLEVSDAVDAKSPVVDGTAVMEDAMFHTLPQEIRKIKDQVQWYHSITDSK